MTGLADGSTGIGGMDQAVAWAVGAAAFLGLGGMLWRFIRPIAKGMNHIMEDWLGTEARPGVPARPGLVERISRIEQRQHQQGDQLAAIEHELHPNSGRSLRDALDRVERHVCPQDGDEPSLAPR